MELKNREWQDSDGLLHLEAGDYRAEVWQRGENWWQWAVSGRYPISKGDVDTCADATAHAETALLEEISKIVRVR